MRGDIVTGNNEEGITIKEKKYTKYIKEAYRYYEKETSICPDAEDIAEDVALSIENEFGINVTDKQFKEILKEIAGE